MNRVSAYLAAVILTFYLISATGVLGQGKTKKAKTKGEGSRGYLQNSPYLEYPQSPPLLEGTQGFSTPLGKVPDTVQGCYTGSQYWPSYRLPNSLDNLVYIVEKIEDSLIQANVSINASFVANLILRRFQVNGIGDAKDSETKIVDNNEQIKQDTIFRLFSEVTYQFPENSIDDREKCALHWMVSSSLNTTNLDPLNTGSIYDPTTKTYSIYDFPRENGVIFAGRYGSFSGGPLLGGIAASSVLSIIRVQDMVSSDQSNSIDPSILSSEIDPILAASLAGEIGQSALLYAYPQYSHPVFGPEGSWNGTICSTTFSSSDKYITAATKAELLGGTDGMVIGNYLRTNYYKMGSTIIPSLSQVLRSYYGRGLDINSFTACDRTPQANMLMGGVTTSATGFAAVSQAKGSFMIGHQYPDQSTLTNSISQAVGNFSQTYLQSQQFSCDQTAVQNTLCQTLNDILFVMDTNLATSFQDNFQEQKNLIGNLIQKIGVYPNNSHVGVLSFGGNKEPVPFDPIKSGGDLRCQLQWAPIYGGSSDVTQTIRYVQDKFRTIRNNQNNGNYPQVPGKVVIFIYLQNSLPNPNQVKEAMNELRREFPDITSLAVGKNRDALKNFVVNEDKDIFNKAGEQLSINVDAIVNRLCAAGATIEYKNCRTPSIDSESNLVATNFVYQDTYQWLVLHPRMMNLSDDLFLNFESTYGSSRICIGRSITSGDPSGLGNCFETSTSAPIYRYGPLKPCESYSYDCPPMYINIRGKSGSGSSDKCSERACDSLNQIKVSLTHEGLKCDGNRSTAVLTTIIFAMSIMFSFRMFYM